MFKKSAIKMADKKMKIVIASLVGGVAAIVVLGGVIYLVAKHGPPIVWQKSKIFNTVIGTDPDLNRRCYATDKKVCDSADKVDLSKLGDNAPALVCGEDHLKKWGERGTNKPGHWCNQPTAIN
jgi:hypothetical protein